MQLMYRFRNFIVTLLLCTLVAGGFHANPVPAATITSQAQGSALLLDAHTISQPSNVCTEQLSQRRSETVFAGIVRAIRTGFGCRYSLLSSLCKLTLLSVLSALIETLFIFHDIRYLYQENFMILFIQDTDGRKRLSYLSE